MKIFKLFLISFFLLVSEVNYVAAAPDKPEKLFRADSRPPSEVARLRGLMPRGVDEAYERSTPIDVSLYLHARGVETGAAPYSSGYVSATDSVNNAHLFGQGQFGGISRYYIYVITPAENFLDVNGILRNYSPNSQEREWASLGGIPTSQIIGWYTVNSGVLGQNMERNPAYNERLFQGRSVAPVNSTTLQLAGFPEGHQAWREQPWSAVTPSSSCQNREIKKSKGELGCKEANQVVAVDYYNQFVKSVFPRP